MFARIAGAMSDRKREPNLSLTLKNTITNLKLSNRKLMKSQRTWYEYQTPIKENRIERFIKTTVLLRQNPY
jgi:hypothetical protein